MKKIIICADDFAQSDAISDAIIVLSNLGRISATSCMTNTTYWPTHSQKLKQITTIDKGLHLNFTHASPLSMSLKNETNSKSFGLFTLLKKISLKQIALSILEDEIEAQLKSFEDNLEQVPDFIDGHQHVHQFPKIRQALLHVYQKKYGHLPFNEKPYFRITIPPSGMGQSFWLKKKIIELLGAKALKADLIKLNIPHNQSNFYGIYPFKKSCHYPEVLQPILASIDDNGLLMCHPGLLETDDNDPIAYHRYKEYTYLASDDFVQICKNQQLQISRFTK